MHFWILFLIRISVLHAGLAKAETTTLSVGYDEYCPYTCTAGSQKGFVIDALEQILAPKGFKIKPVVASWPRVKELAKKRELDLLVPVNHLEAKELEILRTVHSIGTSDAAYFIHKDSKWVYRGVESLKGQTLGIIQGYTYPFPLSSYLIEPSSLKSVVRLASEQGNQRQIKMLASQRVSVAPSERMVFWYMAKQLGLSHLFKEAGVLEMPKDIAIFYVGIVPKNPALAENLLKWLDQGLEDMKRQASPAR